MAAAASPLVIGRYAIYGRIAAGGMASVHLGRLMGAAGFSRTVAIKRLHSHLAAEPEFMATMIDEARLAARIHHPNVVPTLDVVASDGELLLVMEYVRGESLSRLLRAEGARERRAPIPIASAISVGALHGLHAAHEATSDRGQPLAIVHRDVSPQNVLVGIDGVARVIDFGVAKAAGRLQTTAAGVVKGKMAYMSPEQLTGRAVTRRADIYAMAVVIWEMLTGKRLFRADADEALFGLVLAGAREPPSAHVPDLPAGLDDVVMKALARNPEERFATAREMAQQLAAVVPPAFATDVGEWVEEVAAEPLATRLALLAEIESGGAPSAPPPKAAPHEATARPAPATESPPPAVDGEPTRIGSQPSSLSVVTPGPARIASIGPRRGRSLATAVGAGGVLLVAGAIVALRGAAPGPASSGPTTRTEATAAASADVTGPSVPSASASASAPGSAASVPAAQATPAQSAFPDRGPSTPPATAPRAGAPRPAPAPKPPALRFAKPD